MNHLSEIFVAREGVIERTSTAPPAPEEPPNSLSPILTVTHEKLLSELEGLRRRIDTIVSLLTATTERAKPVQPEVTEGVFNGLNMIGADGQEHAVPPNYASKSKLVEGDLMNVRLAPDGRRIFKQIQMIERVRMAGQLGFNEAGREWYAECDGRQYKILTASITFYHAQAGDIAYFLVPKSGESTWGAMDGINIKFQSSNVKSNPNGQF